VDVKRVAGALDDLLPWRPAPAAAVAVVTADGATVERIAGTADLTIGEPATAAHWWDLASLTKHLVTTPAVADLVDRGRLQLSAPLAERWPPAVGCEIGQATIAQLLAYDAGMPASVRLYREPVRDRAELVDRFLRTPQERPAGSGPVYSDVGFLAVGELVASLTGGLDAAALGRGWARFGPPQGPAVAYERDPWRGRLVKGEVHDENAAALGGVAGHAGAFGTLAMVTAAALALLRGDAYPGGFPATEEWSRSPTGNERFGLGWYLGRTRGIGGADPGPDAFGATGFVGNRLWIEPSRGYAVVVVANRVHPTRVDRRPFQLWSATLMDRVRAALSGG
jgi:CubicO group peptidase (beta-lactamase class C family)